MHHLGLTRSANRRDHLLQTPDTFVRTPLPGLKGGMAIAHVGPQAGAAFSMMTVELEAGGALSEGPTQRLVYVLEGEVTLQEPATEQPHTMSAGSYAYLPTEHTHTLTAKSAAKVVVIDKPFLPLEGAGSPKFLIGREENLPSVALNGDEGLQVRSLLPASMSFDFACNTMSYDLGASLSQVEMHYMEHGLLMLEGGGIYRLGEAWYPVEAGDFIWMAPFCPQWFCAVGSKPAKYLIYKDFNRHGLA